MKPEKRHSVTSPVYVNPTKKAKTSTERSRDRRSLLYKNETLHAKHLDNERKRKQDHYHRQKEERLLDPVKMNAWREKERNKKRLAARKKAEKPFIKISTPMKKKLKSVAQKLRRKKNKEISDLSIIQSSSVYEENSLLSEDDQRQKLTISNSLWKHVR